MNNFDSFTESQMLTSKSGLACLLAGENLYVEHVPSAVTASFDLEDRVLTLPAWTNLDETVYNMLIGHEVSHALYTPGFKKWKDAIVYIDPDNLEIAKDYLNVVEDARIERLIKDKYPGLIKDFYAAYKILYDSDKLGKKSMLEDPNIKLPLIDRINLKFKVGIHANVAVKFDSQEELDFVDRVENTVSFEDVVKVAKEIYDIEKAKSQTAQSNGGSGQGKPQPGSNNPADVKKLKINIKKGKNPFKGMKMPGSGGGFHQKMEMDVYLDDEPSEGSGSGGGGVSVPLPGMSAGKNEGSNSAPQLNPDEVDINDETDGEYKRRLQEEINKKIEEAKKQAIADATAAQQGNAPKSVTNDAFAKAIKNLDKLKDGDTRVVYKDLIHTNMMDPAKIVHSYKKFIEDYEAMKIPTSHLDQLMQNFRAQNKGYISQLAQEFERKKAADAQRRVQTSKTGIINMGKLHAYRYSEDIFKKSTVVRDGKNHGMIMVIDWSGSMQTCISDTLIQMLTLVEFCKKIRIPYEVYAFSDQNAQNSEEKKYRVVSPTSLRLIQFMSDKMTLAEYNDALKYLLHYANASKPKIPSIGSVPANLSLGGTPLNSSIIAATRIISDFKKRTKTQITNFMILTDGENTDPSFGNYQAKDILVLRDKQSRNQISINVGKYMYGNQCSTFCLLEMLKKKCDCNTMGFYLIDSSAGANVIQQISNHKIGTPEHTALMDSFTKNKYAEVHNAGYDSYFIVPSNNLTINNDPNYTKSKHKDTESVMKDFENYIRTTRTNRVFLGRLADVIAKYIAPPKNK